MDQQGRIEQARLIARELATLMREDASRRLGIAKTVADDEDKTWSGEFYRRCQLVERLYAILDELSQPDERAARPARRDREPHPRTDAAEPAAPESGRRLGV